MKLIHCADLHLDSKMESIMPTDLAKIRKVEILDTFRRMIDYAYINNINIIIRANIPIAPLPNIPSSFLFPTKARTSDAESPALSPIVILLSKIQLLIVDIL